MKKSPSRRSKKRGPMDRDEAIKLLKGGPDGVREWNRWREQNEKIPDLSGADLRKAFLVRADLDGAFLTDANLRDANLHEADLRFADLRFADLSYAGLGGAFLGGATLFRAILFRAGLIGADLRGADLREAVLSEAILRGADLSQSFCMDTTFGDVDLSKAKGLETIEHAGPSTVGVDTLVRSRGRIPEAFLRGCGVPDSFIVNLGSLIGAMEPIQFYSCFLSHSSKDKPFADRLHGRLEQEKLRVWYAPQDMHGGRKSTEQIDQAIRVHDKLLLMLSKASMASDWVRHEITRAVERERRENCKVLFPIGLSPWKDIKAWTAFDSDMGKDVAKVVREYHIPDFSKWKDHDSFEAAFARLIKDLKVTSREEETKGTKSPGPP